MKTRYPKLRNLALLDVWEDARFWADWNNSLDMYPSYLGLISCVFISQVSSGLTHFLSHFLQWVTVVWWLLSSLQFSHSVVSDSLQSHGLQHARPPCPSPTPSIFSLPSSLSDHQLTNHGGYSCWWLWYSLFADMAGNIPFLRYHVIIR